MGVAGVDGEDRVALGALVALLVPGLVLGGELLVGVHPLAAALALLATAAEGRLGRARRRGLGSSSRRSIDPIVFRFVISVRPLSK